MMNQVSLAEDDSNNLHPGAQVHHGCVEATNSAQGVIVASDTLNSVDTEVLDESSARATLEVVLNESLALDASSFYSDKHLTPTLTQSYRLLHALIEGGDDALRMALRQPPLDQRKRAMPRNRLELIALALTAKPQSDLERDRCSSHSCVMKVARNEKVAVEDFPAWFDDPNNGVKSCRQRAAKKRSKKLDEPIQAQSREPASPPPDGPWLEISVGNSHECFSKHVASISASAAPRARDLIEKKDADAKAGELLKALADAMDAPAMNPSEGTEALIDAPIPVDRPKFEISNSVIKRHVISPRLQKFPQRLRFR